MTVTVPTAPAPDNATPNEPSIPALAIVGVLLAVIAAVILIGSLFGGGGTSDNSDNSDNNVKSTPSSECSRVIPEMIRAYQAYENAPEGSKAKSDARSALRASQLESDGYRC